MTHRAHKLAPLCFGLLAGPLCAQTIYISHSPTGQTIYSNHPTTAQAKPLMQLAAPPPSLADPARPALRTRTSRATPDAATQSLIRQAAARHRIDYHLLMAVIQQESAFDPLAVSHAGARGLMQLMSATAKRYGVTRVHDPGESIAGGSAYLRDMLDMFGRFDLALAAYNAGEGAVLRHGKRIPPYPETQHYVRSVLADYERRAATR
jgi:soluble lytic murein transglycosylase-like protein